MTVASQVNLSGFKIF